MATKLPPTPPPPSPPQPASRWDELVSLAFDLERGLPANEREQAVQAWQQALEASDDSVAAELVDWLAGDMRALASGPAPPVRHDALLRLLQRALPLLGASTAQLKSLPAVLARRDPASLRPLVGPALRFVIGKPRHDDRSILDAWLAHYLKEIFMADITFFIDDSSIPILQVKDAKEKLSLRVVNELLNRFGVPAEKADVTKVPSAAVILGMVVLDGEVDAASSGLPDALRRAWLESIGDIPDNAVPPVKVPLSKVYQFIAENLPALKGGATTEAVQEFAFVAREVIAGASSIPFGHPNFLSAVRIALDKYVETRATGDSLTLPPGSLPGGTQNAGGDAVLNSDNIRVVGLVYPLALLERALVFRVTDRVTELFMNGLLPFGHDAAGKAIDDYHWDSEDRLSESQRRSQFSRMLGMPGGEVSREVAPNKDFEQIFLRLIGSASEFTRQREVDTMFRNSRAPVLSMTGEQVRKCAFELAQNASLYAWGGSFFVATRINQHLQRAIGILNQPQVLKTYAASNHWQVIEKVAQQDFGGAPNWAKYSTMAQSASELFGILANNTAALASASSSRPFLFDRTLNNGKGDGDLSAETTDRLLRSVQQWLAVNGVREDQVQQYAQPVELTSSPSLPGGTALRPDASLEVVNKLKQLVAGGTPSPEQVQQLLANLR